MRRSKPVSLDKLKEILGNLDYPLNRRQLIAYAKENKLLHSSIILLGLLPANVSYDSVDQVIDALENISDPDQANEEQSADGALGSTAMHDGFEDDTSYGDQDEHENDTTYDLDEPEEPKGGSAPN